MESKHAILQSIAEHRLAAAQLPELVTFGIRYEDPQAQFSTVLQAVGGTMLQVPDRSSARREVSRLDVVQQAGRVYSSLPDIVDSNSDIDAATTPHELRDLDLAVLKGQLAVAENAAVWCTEEDLPHRVVSFIAEHVILVVPANQLVHNLHEAYEKLKFGARQYGVFVSGPSKTADIEQSLVIGAQGPRSLHVVLVDEL